MSFEIHKEPQVDGSTAEQVRLHIEHLKRIVKSPYELIEHVIQIYGAEFEKAIATVAAKNDDIAGLTAQLSVQLRANDELFRLKQRVVIANRELAQHNTELVALLKRLLDELPAKRDWLDPELEKMMRNAAHAAVHLAADDAAAVEAHKRKAEDTPA